MVSADPDGAAVLGDRVREFMAGARAVSAPVAAAAWLSDGCALALALEARCRRLHRELARLVDAADDPAVAPRLRTLPPELAGAERQLERLRGVNAALRRCAGRVAR